MMDYPRLVCDDDVFDALVLTDRWDTSFKWADVSKKYSSIFLLMATQQLSFPMNSKVCLR